jgi:hypothetical protein
MPFRKGIYIVPTHRWYIERTVWLVAGVVLLTGTALAYWVNPFFGNILARLGFTPMLGEEAGKRGNWYFMKTDKWYLERRIYLAVGINISIASVLSLVWTPWFLAFTGFVGGAMIWFAATGYCIMANGLYWLGAEPRLAPEKGTASSAVPDTGRPLKA